MGTQDKAKHLATLYLEDISDFIVECVDDNFGFSRYAERLDEVLILLMNCMTLCNKNQLILMRYYFRF
jgi:hypothetical protein